MWRTGIGLVVLVLALVYGCEKAPLSGQGPGDQGQGELKIYLTDGPIDADAVNIVVKEVAVHSEADGWIVINDSVRTFDLLALTNGASVLLGDRSLDAGHYTQIRLLLGSGSNVVVGGTSYPLDIPSGFQTGIKLIHEFTIEPDFIYELLLDFDAGRSLIRTGNGKYKMKPVIRVRPLALSGAIDGAVSPASARTTVTAIAGPDTAAAFADTTSGYFKIIGLLPALYTLKLEPMDTAYNDTTMTNIQVTAGQVKNVGTIPLTLK